MTIYQYSHDPLDSTVEQAKWEKQKRDDRRYELAKVVAVSLIQSETWCEVLRTEFVPKVAVEIADGILKALEESADGHTQT